jgi:putative Ca2+/H+ antiporter (TMEM165/GDT1 family)
LAAHYRKPWPILAGVLLATLANHALAGIIGVWFGEFLSPALLDSVVGVSMIVMALWVLKPDSLDGANPANRRGAFVATVIAFFIAEIGDKTQIATVALAAGYSNLAAVVAGTTCGMLLANAPVVFLGKAFAARLPLKADPLRCILPLCRPWRCVHHPRANALIPIPRNSCAALSGTGLGHLAQVRVVARAQLDLDRDMAQR